MEGALSLQRHGATRDNALAEPILPTLQCMFEGLPPAPGVRFEQMGPLNEVLNAEGLIGSQTSKHTGAFYKPVRMIAFDKSDASNWALGWHQDRTISVKKASKVKGFGPWTTKAGVPHVEPPIGLLEKMVTIRIHLDPVDDENAPLRIALGSHKLGIVSEDKIPETVATCEVTACHAKRGDVWFYSTPILHASDRAAPGRRRRVLQVDYCCEELPAPLEWALQ